MYTVFGVMIVLSVVTAGVLATSLGSDGLKLPGISVSVAPAGRDCGERQRGGPGVL